MPESEHGEDASILDDRPLTPLHKVTIKHLQASRGETVPVTVIRSARADRLLAARQRLKDEGTSVTLTAMIAYDLAQTLARHPDINALIAGDRLVRYRDVGLGLAVADRAGNLMVPVVPRAQSHNLLGLASLASDAAQRVRDGRVRPGDVRGGTWTLSSVGMVMEGGAGSAVIPAGQAGVLVVGGLARTPIVEGDRVVVGTTVPLSLTFDHRIANGVALWTFFKDLIDTIESTPGGEQS